MECLLILIGIKFQNLLNIKLPTKTITSKIYPTNLSQRYKMFIEKSMHQKNVTPKESYNFLGRFFYKLTAPLGPVE